MSGDVIHSGILQIEVDGSGVTSGIAEPIAAVNRFEEAVTRASKKSAAELDKVEQAGKKTGRNLASLGDGVDTAAKKVERATASMFGQLQRLNIELASGGKNTRAFFEATAVSKGVDVNALKPMLDQLDALKIKQELAAKAMLSTAPAFTQMGMSAAATANALRGVPAQFTDIATSLQGGQKPLTVLLQQGGQLKDMFGGVGPAAKAMGGYILGLINPYTLAAAAAATLAYAYSQGSKENDAYAKSLILTGNAAGLTADKLHLMAERISTFGVTQSEAGAALAEFASSSNISVQGMERFASVAVKMQKETGQAVADTVKQFAELGKDPVSASVKLNETTHFLTAEIYKQIKALDDQGRSAEAAALAQNAYADVMNTRMSQLAGRLGTIEKLWRDVAFGAKLGWDAMLDVGRPDTNFDKINAGLALRDGLEKQLQSAEKYGDKARAEYLKNQLAGNKDLINGLRAKADTARALAATEKVSADKATQQVAVTGYIDNTKYADKKTKYSLEVKAENQAFATAVKGFETTSKEYEQAVKRHKGNLAQIADQNKDAKAESAVNKEASAYASLIASIKEKTEVNKLELTSAVNATESQKAGIKLDQDLASGKVKLSAAHIAAARAALVELSASEKLIKAKEAEKDVAKYIELSTLARKVSAEQLAIEYQLYGQSNDARDLAMVGIKEQTALERFLLKEKADGKSITAEQVASLNKETAARIAVEQATLAQGKALGYAQQLADANARYAAEHTGDESTRAAAMLEIDANVWRERVRLAGDGTEAQKALLAEYATWYASKFKDLSVDLKINGLDNVADDFARMSTAADSFGDNLKKVSSSLGGISKAFRSLADAEAKERKTGRDATSDRIGAYGDMAGAAKGFFDENSKGYKTLDGISKAFHAAQMAMQLVEMGQTAVLAVMNQAKGDPYTAWARMAAMAAAMAALGYAVGGGFNSSSGDATSSESRQKTQGTGTVLGDSSTKSDSIQKAMEGLKDNTYTQLTYSSKMLDALKSIDMAMGGLAQILFRTAGITAGNKMGIFEGVMSKNTGDPILKMFGGGDDSNLTKKLPIIGTLVGALQGLWGKTTQQITDSGLSINGTLGDLSRGHGVNQYASVQQTSSSWFGLKKDVTNSTQFDAIDQSVADQIGKVFKGISDTVMAASVTFGLDANSVAQKIAGYVVDIPRLSLRGLKGQDLQDAINAVFASAADSLSASLLPGLEEFQKVGEGYFQTLVRVSDNLVTANMWMGMLGKTLFDVSIAGAGASTKLVDMFGSMADFNSATSAYYDAYYSDSERAAASTKRMGEALGLIGLAVPSTKDGFRDLVTSLDLTTDAGRSAYAALLTVAPEFAAVADLVSKVAKETADKLMATFGADSIDFAGLSKALQGANVETFTTTMGLVFENLAARIKSVVDGIANERTATAQAALQISNPAAMGRAEIQAGIAGINTSLPGNSGVLASLSPLSAAYQASDSKARALSIAQSSRDSIGALLAKAQAGAAVQASAPTTYQAGQTNDPLWEKILGVANANHTATFGIPMNRPWNSDADSQRGYADLAAQYGREFTANKAAEFAPQIASLSASFAQALLSVADAQAQVSIANSAQATAAEQAKAAQLAYADALQNFTIEASKSVGKLSKLREETVKYYDAQKRLADLMGASAAGLRKTSADYRVGQLSPEDQFRELSKQFAGAYSMGLSTDGAALAGYGDKLNAMVSPLLTLARDTMGSDTAYASFAANTLAQVDAIAAKLEALTPTDYAADSLAMLGQIDATLAALDASSQSAEQIISAAIKSGADQTVAGLHAVIAALTGQSIPGFATGGNFAGGLRIVGERGPELEATGPSRIFSNSQTRSMLGGGNSARLESLVERLTQEVEGLRSTNKEMALDMRKLKETMVNVTQGGESMLTVPA